MRKPLKTALVVFLALGLTAGKKSKKKDAEEAPAPAPAAAEQAPEEAPMPEPEPEPEPAKAEPNADFNAKIVRADGSTKSGHVVRVERSEDWYAEEGWTDKPVKLTVTVEGGGTMKDVTWDQIKAVDVAYLGKSAIDCTYDSEYTPLMWTCTMKTKSSASLKEGGTMDVSTRHKWKFVFEDGAVEEFWIYKLPEREQEETVADMNAADKTEVVNADLQIALQSRVMEAAGKAVKRIEITAP